MGQLDPQADRRATGLPRAAVRGLHHAGAATRDNRVTAIHEKLADALGAPVEGLVGAGASRTEYRDGGADLREGLEALDELGLDA